ncbi:MAG: carboxypeptidase regulatory-like domain-containing protein [Clostridia bacterium]|nr:carboxypeptidase regulatory-like domain-containing protein [Clostridia bacterium]
MIRVKKFLCLLITLLLIVSNGIISAIAVPVDVNVNINHGQTMDGENGTTGVVDFSADILGLTSSDVSNTSVSMSVYDMNGARYTNFDWMMNDNPVTGPEGPNNQYIKNYKAAITLPAGFNYIFQIVADNNGEITTISKNFDVRHIASIPENISFVSQQMTNTPSIDLSWTALQGATRYEVYYSRYSGYFTHYKLSTNNTTISINIPDSTGVWYVYVIAYNDTMRIGRTPQVLTGNVKTITGTISLPGTDIAPQGGVKVDVEAFSDNNTPDDKWDDNRLGVVFLTIPEGSNSTQYTITLPDNAVGAFRINYRLVSQHNYAEQGYYSSNGTVPRFNEATIININGSSVSGINLNLLACKSISGTLSLPGSDVAPQGGLEVNIGAYNDNGTPQDHYDDYYVGRWVTIPEGASTVNYTLRLPLGIAGSYAINYRLSSPSVKYLDSAFYSTNGTVPGIGKATPVGLTNSNTSGINFSILTGKVISGTLALPGTNVAPVKGIQVSISAQADNNTPDNHMDDYGIGNMLIIPEGSNSIDYSLTVPEGIGAFKVGYRIEQQEAASYVREGFFGVNGTVINYDEAEPVDVSFGNRSNINIAIMAGKTISGTVSLPGTDVAPEGGTRVTIEAVNDSGTPEIWEDDFRIFLEVAIPGGSNAANYSITVPPSITGQYRINYYLESTADYVKQGYYSINGTVPTDKQATAFDLSGGSKTGINLILLKGKTISGTIALPGVDVAPQGGMSLELISKIYNNTATGGDIGYGTSIWVKIPEGNKSASYTITVPDSIVGTYKLIYRLSEQPETNYIREAYYSSNGTVLGFEAATALDLSNGNLSGINMDLIKGKVISGVVKLPSGYAPAGGTGVSIRGWSDNGTEFDGKDDISVWSDTEIFEGKNFANYTLVVPCNSNITFKITAEPWHWRPSDYVASTERLVEIAAGDFSNTVLDFTLGIPQVIGTVADPTGIPMENSNVDIRKSTGEWVQNVWTDKAGKFKIGSLADGKYILRAAKWDSAFTESPEVTITISGGAFVPDTTNNPLVLKLAMPQISGTVRYPGGQTAAYGHVDVIDLNGMHIAGTGIDEHGKFVIGGLKAGTYKLKAYPSWNNTQYTASLDTVVEITSASKGLNIDIMLSSPQIKGTVTAGGNPVDEGWIEIIKKVSEYEHRGMPGVSIVNGLYSIGGLEDGTYIIKANPRSGSMYSSSQDVEVIINGANSQTINLVLRDVQVTGKIQNPQGDDVPFGWVEIRRVVTDSANAKEYWATGVPVNELGAFSIGGLTPGTYELKAFPSWDSEYTPSQEMLVTIGNDLNASPSNIILTIALPQVKGKAISPDGIGQQHTYIEIRDLNGNYVTGISTDYEGNFKVGGLKNGNYIIKAHPSWGSQYTASDEIQIAVQNGVSLTGVLVTLNQPQLSGIVKKPDGTAAIGSYVEVRDSEGRWIAGTGVDENGAFRLGALKDGKYVLQAYPQWGDEYCESAAMTVEISNKEFSGGQLTLDLTRPIAIGTVKDPSGTNVVPYGMIEIKNAQTGEWVPGVGVDNLGKFKLKNLPDGTYALRAIADWNSANNYTSSDEKIITISGGAVTSSTLSNLTINLNSYKIKGMVKTPDGLSNTGFGWVEVTNSQGMWVTGTPVDDKGNFKLGKIGPAGTYKIKVYPNWESQYLPSQEVEIQVDGDGNYVSGGEYTGGILNIRLSNVVFTGRVIKASGGQPAQYGWIEIQKVLESGETQWLPGTGVDFNGEFRVGQLSDGTYKIKAYPEYKDEMQIASEYYTITVANGVVTGCDVLNAYDSNNKVLTVKLPDPQITGTVKGPNGESVSYGWIEVRDSNDNYVQGIGANHNGSFAIGGLQSGTYKLRAYPGWGSEFSESKFTEVIIPQNSTQSTAVILNLSGAQLTGTVVGPEGQKINKAWVEVYYIDQTTQNRVWVASSGVDENGRFKIGGLENRDDYKIEAFAEPGSPYANSNSMNLRVSGGVSTPSTLEIRLTNANVTGTVNNPYGSRSNGGWVEVGDQNQKWLLTVQVGKDGTFKLPALQNGTYTIQAFFGEGNAAVRSDVQNITIDGTSKALVLNLK